MKYVDKKFSTHRHQYILQSILATSTLFVILLFLNYITEAAIITALGASSFIVFAMPHHYSSKSTRIIGGYSVGLIVGFFFYILSESRFFISFFDYNFAIIFLAAASVGVTIFFMVLFNIEHAPACGVALGLVINKWTEATILFIIAAIIWLILVKAIANKWLIDLTRE